MAVAEGHNRDIRHLTSQLHRPAHARVNILASQVFNQGYHKPGQNKESGTTLGWQCLRSNSAGAR